jgi:hypothetical protein
MSVKCQTATSAPVIRSHRQRSQAGSGIFRGALSLTIRLNIGAPTGARLHLNLAPVSSRSGWVFHCRASLLKVENGTSKSKSGLTEKLGPTKDVPISQDRGYAHPRASADIVFAGCGGRWSCMPLVYPHVAVVIAILCSPERELSPIRRCLRRRRLKRAPKAPSRAVRF